MSPCDFQPLTANTYLGFRHIPLEVTPEPREEDEGEGRGGEIEGRMDEGDLQARLVDHREQGADGELQHCHEERQAGEIEAGIEEGEAARESSEGGSGDERDPARTEIGADDHPDGERRVEQSAGDREDRQADDDRRGLHEHREGRAEDQRAQGRGQRVAPGQYFRSLRQREEGRAD